MLNRMPAIKRGVSILIVLLGTVTFTACESASPEELGPPAGWEGTATRWWPSGADTAGMFRDLETLEAMRVDLNPVTYASAPSLAMQGDVARSQLEQAVKVSLIRLYRNQPAVVDSLFERFVAPKIEEASLVGDFDSMREHFKREGYRIINNNFQEPRAALQLGKDVLITFPDSLRERQIGGTVRTQVYVDEKGEPRAIELLEGVHPVLDALAMRATTQMRWRPAYLLRNRNWKPVPSWVRFNVNFMTPQAEDAG